MYKKGLFSGQLSVGAAASRTTDFGERPDQLNLLVSFPFYLMTTNRGQLRI